MEEDRLRSVESRAETEVEFWTQRRRWLGPLYVLAMVTGIVSAIRGVELAGWMLLATGVFVLLAAELCMAARIYGLLRLSVEATFAWVGGVLFTLTACFTIALWWSMR